MRLQFCTTHHRGPIPGSDIQGRSSAPAFFVLDRIARTFVQAGIGKGIYDLDVIAITTLSEPGAARTHELLQVITWARPMRSGREIDSDVRQAPREARSSSTMSADQKQNFVL